MNPIMAATILICLLGIGEIVAIKSKAYISSMLFLSATLLVLMWMGLPKDIIQISGFIPVSGISVGLLMIHMGSMIDMKTLLRQWKTFILGLSAVVAVVLTINTIGPMFIDRFLAVSASPVVAGGVVSQLIISSYLKEAGMLEPEMFTLVVLMIQGIIGMPIASMLLKREAVDVIDSGRYQDYLGKVDQENSEVKRLIPPIPEKYQTSGVLMGVAAVLTTLGFMLSGMTKGAVNSLVICLIIGVIAAEIGLVEKGFLDKAKASGFITLIIIMFVFANIGNVTLEMLMGFIYPLIVVFLLGVIGITLVSFALGKILKVSTKMSIAIGLTCLFGFPATFLIASEVSNTVGKTDEEREALNNYLVPPMLTAGFVTVSIASVVIAGFVTRFI